jgi:hypothetical protein
MIVRFDLSDWEWANMLVGQNYRPDRLPKPVIDAECLLLGDKRTSIGTSGTSLVSQKQTLGRFLHQHGFIHQ